MLASQIVVVPEGPSVSPYTTFRLGGKGHDGVNTAVGVLGAGGMVACSVGVAVSVAAGVDVWGGG